jgi:hypothetical protein
VWGNTIVELKTNDVDGIVVRVRRGLEIKGHVEPRQVCDVALPEADTGDPSARRESMMVTTSDSGVFRFAPLAPGKATVTARCPNGDEVLLQELPPTSGPDGRFQVQGESGKMMLVVLARPPMLKHGLSLEAGKTIDIGDVTLDKPE